MGNVCCSKEVEDGFPSDSTMVKSTANSAALAGSRLSQPARGGFSGAAAAAQEEEASRALTHFIDATAAKAQVRGTAQEAEPGKRVASFGPMEAVEPGTRSAEEAQPQWARSKSEGAHPQPGFARQTSDGPVVGRRRSKSEELASKLRDRITSLDSHTVVEAAIQGQLSDSEPDDA